MTDDSRRYADVTRRLRDQTAPSPQSVARVRAKLDRALLPATPELRQLPPVSADAVARVKRRLATPQRRPVPVWLGATVAFAAVSAVAGWFALGSEKPVHAELSLGGDGVEHVENGLALTHQGDGRAVVDGDRVQVDWEYGRLVLDPPADLAVAVVTPEGRVEGKGAALVVVRDAVGTRIEVERGSAEVRCGEQGPRALTAGSVGCDPLTATGWLTRARTHLEGAASIDVVLADVDAGLSRPDATDLVRAELLTLETTALVGAGRNADALSAAERALAVTTDPARAEDLHRTAAHLALLGGDCAAAAPHLRALGAPTDEERAFLARCR